MAKFDENRDLITTEKNLLETEKLQNTLKELLPASFEMTSYESIPPCTPPSTELYQLPYLTQASHHPLKKVDCHYPPLHLLNAIPHNLQHTLLFQKTQVLSPIWHTQIYKILDHLAKAFLRHPGYNLSHNYK